MKIAGAVVFVCLLVATPLVMGDNYYLMADHVSLRLVKSDTGVASTLALSQTGTAHAAAANAATNPAYSSPKVNPVNNVMYAVDYNGNKVVSIDMSTSPFTVATLAGQPTAGAKDGSGSNAQFNQPWSLDFDADGNVLVLENAGAVIRKVTPAGDVTTVVGQLGTSGSTEGQGTTATLSASSFMTKASDGTLYVSESGRLRVVAPDLQTSTLAGDGTAAVMTAAVGSSAKIAAQTCTALSADGKTLYAFGNGAAFTGTTNGQLASINLESKAVELTIPAPAAAANSKDATGTDAVFLNTVSGCAMGSDGNLVFLERGINGGAVRKYNPTTKEMTTMSSTIVLAGLTTGGLGTGDASYQAKDGAADVAQLESPWSLTEVQLVCDKVYPGNSTVKIDSTCETLKGSVESLNVADGGKVTVSEALTVAGAATVGANSQARFSAPTTIAGALTLSGNGTVVVNGAAVTADSLTLGSETSYSVLINSLTPAVLTVANAAALDGAVVIAIDSAFDFFAGNTATILNFGSSTGNFAQVFFLKLRSAITRKALQSAASAATVSCGSTSCAATGVAASSDDDDEVPFLVALIIVAIALFVAIVAGLLFLAASKSRGNTAAAAVPVSSSSSSTYDVFGQDAFGEDYYSYSY